MAETSAKYFQWDEVEKESLNPHIDRQLIVGSNIMVARLVLKKGATVPWHSHYNEQVSYVVQGALQFHIDDQEITVHGGEVLCIPPDMPHEARALEDSIAMDIFNPPRQDWIDKDDAYLRQPTVVKG